MSVALDKYLKQTNKPATINWTSNQQTQFRYAMRLFVRSDRYKALM
jgi:hypothetical protein